MKLIEIPMKAVLELKIEKGTDTKTFETKSDGAENDKLLVLLPVNPYGEIAIKKGYEFTLYYNIGGVILMWNCKAGKTIKSNNVSLLEIIPIVAESQTYNRRNGYRVTYNEHIEYFEDTNIKLEGKIKNISISGIAFCSTKPHEIGQILHIEHSINHRLDRYDIEIAREGPCVDGIHFYGAKFVYQASEEIERLINGLQLKEIRNKRKV